MLDLGALLGDIVAQRVRLRDLRRRQPTLAHQREATALARVREALGVSDAAVHRALEETPFRLGLTDLVTVGFFLDVMAELGGEASFVDRGALLDLLTPPPRRDA